MPTYVFLNTQLDEIEVYETAECETLRQAITHAKKIWADEINEDVEIWEYQFTVHPLKTYRDDDVKAALAREIDIEEGLKQTEKFNGYTIHQWQEKYAIADQDRQRYAKESGKREAELRSWSAMAERIAAECGFEWPTGVPFDEAFISAYKSRGKTNDT